MLALSAAAAAFMSPVAPATKMPASKVVMMGGKGFGGGEATRDPEPTVYDPNDPKGKQQAIHKAESFAEYLAKRGAGGAAPSAPAAAPPAAAPAAGGGGIGATLASLAGPEVFWGPDGVAFGHEESDVKGYDTFSKFTTACAQNGIDLDAGGPYTVFAPPDEVIDDFLATPGAALTADVLKYHVVLGEVSTSAFSSADLTTMQGSSLTYRRMFRKDFIDDATPGVKSEGAALASNWPADVSCSNGVIHSCNQVLKPGWTPV